MSDQHTKVADGEAPKVEVIETTAVADAQPVKSEDVATKVEASDDKPVAVTTTVKAEDKSSQTTVAEKDSRPSVANPPSNMLKVTRPDKNENDKYKKNKFDPSILGESSDPKEIRTQVHFYFSDSNLPTDNYMMELTGGPENKPVSLAKICSFKRMRRFKPYSAVVAALKESKFLTVEGNEGEETIKRQRPFDPEKKREADEQSTYVKGFGEEESSTQFDIEAFFSQYGTYNAVRLRRGENGGFKGSVFVEWSDKETADKFLALESKPQWKGHDLLIMSKLAYIEEKNQMIRDGKIAPRETSKYTRGRSGNFNRGRGRGGGNIDANDWKKRREHDQKTGFNDRRGGREGRGRGRGRGNFRGGRGDRDRGDNGRPRDSTENKDGEAKSSGSPKANGKRARDEDTKDEPPAKKVDAKEVAAEAA